MIFSVGLLLDCTSLLNKIWNLCGSWIYSAFLLLLNFAPVWFDFIRPSPESDKLIKESYLKSNLLFQFKHALILASVQPYNQICKTKEPHRRFCSQALNFLLCCFRNRLKKLEFDCLLSVFVTLTVSCLYKWGRSREVGSHSLKITQSSTDRR